MSDNHIADPLDYLYEELPPERMAEARKHLAACPDCRARVREIRETVKLYRQTPAPTPPPGLAARAAAAAIAAAADVSEADKAAVALDRISGTGAPARAHPSAAAPARASARAADAPARQARLEEEFTRLKREVREEMRRGWRQWFFHPAWTIAASALLLASLAIHFSPRARYAQQGPVQLRESLLSAGSAREIRNRERIPAPQFPAAAVELAEAPDLPVMSTPLPPAPAALREANARRDLPLPSLARMRSLSAPTAARAPAPVAAAPAAPMPMPVAAAEEEAALAETSAPVVELAEARVAVDAALEPAEAAAEAPPAALAAAPAQSGEITPVLSPEELAALAAAPMDADAEEASFPIVALADMEPPQLFEQPEGFDAAERVRTLTALAGMQIASGEIVDAWKTVEMLRRYSPVAAEELSILITEAEKAALAEKKAEPEPEPASAAAEPVPEPEAEPVPAEEPPPPAPESKPEPEHKPEPEPTGPIVSTVVEAAEPDPAPARAPVPAAEPVPVPPFPGAMIEPPEDPPLSMVIVPEYMRPTVPAGIAAVPNADAPVISEALPVIPLQVYIRPVVPAPAPVFAPAPEPPPTPVSAAAAAAAAPEKPKRKRERFTTDPYLRDD